MSACLDAARIQAVADNEASAPEVEHAERCGVCRARVAEARAVMTEFGRGLQEVAVPPMLGARVNAAVARSAAQRSGATTLGGRPDRRPRWLVAGLAAAAAVLALVFVFFPSFDSSTRLSAAEILDRSLQALSVHGAERLRYELTVEAPTAAADTGTFLIEQLIDHQTGRWRFSRFDANGMLLNGIAENPGLHTREAIMTVDGQIYRFRFAIDAGDHVALWDLQRRYAEVMIRLVQSSGAQVVTTEQGPDGERYVVDVPPTERQMTPAPFDLTGARVIVDASDFHIVEFTAAGNLMGEHVSVGYRLVQRDFVGGELPAADFSFGSSAPGTIELQGHGSKELPRDFLALLLREIAVRRQEPVGRDR